MEISNVSALNIIKPAFSGYKNSPKTNVNLTVNADSVEINKTKQNKKLGAIIGAILGLRTAIPEVYYNMPFITSFACKSGKTSAIIMAALPIALQTAVFAGIGAGIGSIVDAVNNKKQSE